MKFDVTKLTYVEIEELFSKLRGTPGISKLGENVLVNFDTITA